MAKDALLRYPGGKTKVTGALLELVPSWMEEYREPMLGGGALLLAIKRKYPQMRCWVGDINPELIRFWIAVQNEPEKLVKRIEEIRGLPLTGRELYAMLRDAYGQGDTLKRAARFYVLNRISYSGLTDVGGYSEDSYQKFKRRKTYLSILSVAPLLQNVKITETDYETLVLADGKNVVIYLDPPYAAVPKPRLYGKDGILHKQFDHTRLAETLKKCPHAWLMTYDDCPLVRNLYKDYTTYTLHLYYSFRAAKGKKQRIAQELIITHKLTPHQMGLDIL